MMRYFFNDGYSMFGYGRGLLMLFCMFIFIGLIALGIYALIHFLQKSNKSYSHSALDILNERYAKGEINHDEYEKIKSQLNR